MDPNYEYVSASMISMGLYITKCKACGDLVLDAKLHTEFHSRVDPFPS